MSKGNKNKFTIRAKRALLEAERTITDLAAEVGRPRSTVSKAINSDKFPRVRQAVAANLKICV